MNTVDFEAITWLFVKLMAIIGLGIYTLYAGIIVRQEQLMAKVLVESANTFLRLLALAHFIAAVALLVLAIIIL